MSNGARNKSTAARRVWQQMFDLLMRTAPQRMQSLGKRGLTPNDARGISSLDPVEGRTMKSLADEWRCDASNATWIVDRLEKMGLAERKSVPHDRRVKLVVLTRKGLKLRTELMEEYYDPPADILRLSSSQLEVLDEVLGNLAKEGRSPTSEQRIQPARNGRAAISD
jgi:MarR family transcriptional regulator, organic hydroperoxide resistance regulator